MSHSDWLEQIGHCAAAQMLERRLKRDGRRRGLARHLANYQPEWLEGRVLLSAAGLTASPPIVVMSTGDGSLNAPGDAVPDVNGALTPGNIQIAYGVNSISFSGVAGTGAGQTIAIIDAYNDPNIIADAATFSTQYGLPQFNTTGNPTLKVLNESGQASPLAANTTSSTHIWDEEICADVEWAHSIAPMANIILFEAGSSGLGDLYSAAATAAAYAGVSVVSMSFGSSEFSSESNYDSMFTTPAGHQGVTFLASTGDSGSPAEYPAYSPNVVAVGGSVLTVNSNGSYNTESGWSGSGGGISKYETQPSFQSGNVNGLSTTLRTAPDVSILATGLSIYDSWAGGANNGGYVSVSGTSLSCPIWAGLIAIADQGRVANGLGTLDGPSQTLPMLYQLPSSDFHDITSGSNGTSAGAGYDLVSGRGTPMANLIVPALVGVTPGTASKLSFSVSPSNATAGGSISVTVQVLDGSGNLVATDASNITLSFGNNPGGGALNGTTTVAAVNGVATFTGLSINIAGAGYTLTASDGSLAGATSGSFAISAATASKLVIANQPTAASVGVAISPAVTVAIEDAYGNIVTTNSSTVTLTLSTGGSFTGGLTTASGLAASGIAAFGNLKVATAGSFTLAASDGSLTATTSNSFAIAKGTPVVGVTDAGGTYGGVAFGATAAYADDANSGATLVSFGSGLLSYSYYAGTLTTANQVAGATPLGAAPIAAGAYTIVAMYAGATNYNSASSLPVNFSIAQRALHVTAVGVNKIYDGTTAATVTLGDDRIGGDVLVIAYGSATFASKNVSSAIAISVGGITMSGAAAADYTLANTTASASANITPVTLTGSISANNKTYDGTTAATIATRTLSGVLGSDAVSLTGGSGTFNTKDVATATTVTVTGLSLSGAQAGDYVLSNPTETASATITAFSITGSITANNKIYDGTTSATIATRSLTGVLGSDAVTLAGGSATFNSKDVASATTVTATGLSLSGAQAGDYTLSNPTETASATITPLSITGSITANSKTYDGTTATTLATRMLNGVLGSDVVTLTGGSATFNSKDVASATTVTATGLSLSGAQAGDYSLSNPAESASASISPLSISGSITANSKAYDGTTSATIATRSLIGVLGADAVTLAGGSATFNAKDVATANLVTATGLNLGGAQAADYSLSNSTETASATITPLSITGSVTAANRIYDQTTSATITGRSLTGVLGSDNVTLTGGVGAFNTRDVSTATTVTVTGFSLAGAQAGDYALSNSTATAAAHITPLAASGSITANNKVYNGTTAATLAIESLSGILSGDTVNLTGGSAIFNSKDVATATTVTAGGLTLSGAQAGDYTLSNPTESAAASITPLSITGSITAGNKVYDGTTSATIATRHLTGILGADAVSLAGGSATFNTKNVATANLVTATGLSLTGAQAGDYSLANSTETCAASITPLGITGSVTAGSKVYDHTTAATFAINSLTGVLGVDDVELTGGSATFNSKDVNSATTVSVTDLGLIGTDADDYSLTNPTETASASITPASLTGSILANNKTYNGTVSAAFRTGTLTGLFTGDAVSLSGSATFNSKDVDSATTVTATALTLSGAQAADYALANTVETAPASIAPASLTAVISAADKSYDGTTTATLTGETLVGIFGGDSVTSSAVSATFNNKNAGNGKTVTAAGLTLSGPAAQDYTLANPNPTTTANITPLAITGSLLVANKTYDGTAQAVITGVTLSGILTGDSVMSAGGLATFATKDVGNGIIVTATGIGLTGTAAGNYTLGNPTEVAAANITPLAVTGSISAYGKAYDGTTAASLATRSLNGVLAGDNVSLVGGAAAFNSADVPTATTVTATGLTLAGAQAQDYVLTNATETASASISPLGISGTVTAADKIFDGTAAATLVSRSLSGIIGNDSVSLSGGSASFNTSTVGNNKTVTAGGLALTGPSAADYHLLNPAETTTASIFPLTISGKVFNDTANQVGNAMIGSSQPGAEPGLAGRTVTLQVAGKGTKGQKTTKTDSSGNFTFSNLAAGNYVVKISLPAHWHNTSSTAANPITIQPGGAVPQLLFGQSDAATVSGSIFLDANKDGLRQARESGLAGWTVLLTARGSTSPTFTATTDANGNYTFSAVPIGNYQLSFTEVAGYSPTAKAKESYALALSAGKVLTARNFGQQPGTGSKQNKSRRAA
jgi:subtilase family serine protease